MRSSALSYLWLGFLGRDLQEKRICGCYQVVLGWQIFCSSPSAIAMRFTLHLGDILPIPKPLLKLSFTSACFFLSSLSYGLCHTTHLCFLTS